MKINKTTEIVKKIFLILILISFSNCKNQNKTELDSDINEIKTDSTQIEKEVNKKTDTIKTEDIEYILLNLNDETKINEKITNLDFKKKFNSIYISKLSDMNSKPISWITITDLDLSSMVSFKTSEEKYFDDLIENVKSSQKSKEIKTNKFETKLIGDKYTYEIYKPKNGINTLLNEYNEIIIYRTKK